MKNKLVSIGMPVFNGGKHIRDALDSLLAQTYRNFELIISDNSSTDETEQICREYEEIDFRIRYIRQPENLGATENFQFVLARAKGEYFMWAAHDDIWDPCWIETLLPVAVKGNCIAHGSLQTIDVDGEVMHHAACNQRFSFSGSRWHRRCKFFLSPGCLGKANLIYGVGALGFFTEARIVWAKSSGPRGDIALLYALLGITDIRQEKGVCRYVRVHSGSAGLIAERDTQGVGVFLKSHRLLMKALRAPGLSECMKSSGLLDAFTLAFLYPGSIIANTAYSLLFRIKRG